MAVIAKGAPLRHNEYVSGGVIKDGDFVTVDANGNVVVAAASQALLGVAVHAVTASGMMIKIWDHPDQLFIVPCSASTPSATTEFNLNYNIVANTTPANQPLGNHTLDSASGATTATLPLKALRPSPQLLQGSVTSAICSINNHVLNSGTGTAGI